jgi:hypothetical protein
MRAPASRGAAVGTLPAGTVIPVVTAGLVTAATSRPGDSVHATILQPVVVNGAVAIPANTTVALQVVAGGDGPTVQLVSLAIGGGTVAAGPSRVALDPQAAAGNAAIERAIAAAAASPRGAGVRQALAGRLVVLNGQGMNLPSGTRLTFTLTAAMTLERPQ